MNIYKFDSTCYKCNNPVTYYTYLVFHEYEDDVTFPLDMSYVCLVYSQMPAHKDNPYFDSSSYALNYPIKILGDDDELDERVINSGKFPNIKKVKTKGACKTYAANICPHCNSLLGNYHLREKITDSFLKPNIPMEKFCEIS
ncbi:MAG: hypothetical protein NC299_15395 [Lachnospiraceae bacterium]|nr:hypothetical protein [Ruminococcus sp.]MCM1276718.1 hypothetical protein [Lachnospiraceae bacterium]